MAVNYSILVDVDLNTKNVQRQLDKKLKGMKVNLGTDPAIKGMEKLDQSAADTLLTFQAANAIFRKTVDVLSSMVDQVYKLDAAMIEYQKVSDLAGGSLDRYIDKLSMMGGAVARTGSEMLESAT